MAATLGIYTNGRKTSNLKTVRQLTENDTKILGPKIGRKLEKTVSSSKFQSRNFKTLNSAYTPIVHKPSNEQVSDGLMHFKNCSEYIWHMVLYEVLIS